MRPVLFPPEKILGLFRKHKVLTKAEVLEACGCKTMTFWKVLREYGYWSSYNWNAKYYTLFDIPTFDEWGLWSYRHVRFSCQGSLSQTIVELVERSRAGYDAKELSERLGVPVGPELSRLYGQERIRRQKSGPRYVYLASQTEHGQRQVQRREAQWERLQEEAVLPVPELIIAVLVDLVQHPQTDLRTLTRRLQRRKVPVTRKQVEHIFEHYGLAGKKGR